MIKQRINQVYHLDGGLIGWVKERYALVRQTG